MHADTRRRMQLATELRQGLERDELRVMYQPSVDLQHGRIVACEALVRWQHPDRGLLMPADFIAVAEELGLIRIVDEWVLAAACAQIKAWDSSGMPAIRVAVNISARWFGHPGFLRSVTDTLRENGIPPDRIVLEITEGAMLRLGDDIERTMQTLHKNGVAVAIDDFGTGYSSMAYLKLPAVAYLKIDRSFVIGLPDDSNDAAIAKAILAMAHSLGLETIAEGIETEEQHKFLRQAGCGEGQGFLYSFPLEPQMVEELLRPKVLALPRGLSVVPPKRSR
jgi:EAL domain-containing protein (putative c-di-GMP-specific phosphodiesterase class I)